MPALNCGFHNKNCKAGSFGERAKAQELFPQFLDPREPWCNTPDTRIPSEPQTKPLKLRCCGGCPFLDNCGFHFLDVQAWKTLGPTHAVQTQLGSKNNQIVLNQFLQF